MPLVAKPPHVPDALVVDWDFYNPPGADIDVNAAWKKLHDGPDIVWTPHNGGHWIATRAEDIEFIQKNHDPFSMQKIVIPLMSTPIRLLPLEVDPPDHARFRTIINRFFTPRALKELQDGARQLAIELIDGFKRDGRCDFIRDFSMKLPIVVFMRMVDQPMDDLEQLLAWTEKAVRPKTATDMTEAFHGISYYIAEVIRARQANPGTDILSAVVGADVAGEPIKHDDMTSLLINLLFGGLDTVASALGFAALFLARNPDKRQELIDRPDLIPNAVDELLRLFPPSSTGRLIVRDCDYKGIPFKQGEQIYVRPLLHGMDERKFDNPLEANWERHALERNYASFGNGPHRCPGAALARSEMRIFIEEWLLRIPHFRPDPDNPPRFGSGMVNAVLHLPLVWDYDPVR
jgi:cytochrome P450